MIVDGIALDVHQVVLIDVPNDEWVGFSPKALSSTQPVWINQSCLIHLFPPQRRAYGLRAFSPISLECGLEPTVHTISGVHVPYTIEGSSVLAAWMSQLMKSHIYTIIYTVYTYNMYTEHGISMQLCWDQLCLYVHAGVLGHLGMAAWHCWHLRFQKCLFCPGVFNLIMAIFLENVSSLQVEPFIIFYLFFNFLVALFLNSKISPPRWWWISCSASWVEVHQQQQQQQQQQQGQIL